MSDPTPLPEPDVPDAGAPAPPRSTTARRLVRVVWLLLVVGALAYVLVDRWDEVQPALRDLQPLDLVVPALAAFVGIAASGMVWRSLLAGLGSPLPLRPAARVFFVGQLAKYVPGSVWAVVAQMDLARDYAVPVRSSASAFALFMWVHVLSGAAVAALALPLAGVVHPIWALAAVPCLALLAPGMVGRSLAFVLRLLRRRPLPALPDARSIAAALLAAAVMWLCYGVHLLTLARAFDSDPSLLLAVGGFAAAWTAGFVFIPAPAGAGVREAVLIVLLAGVATPGQVVAIAVVSRLLHTAADAVLGVGALIATRTRATVST